MYQPLLESSLSDQYHLIAPDYPGFGHSSWPDHKTFDYTFDHLAKVMEDFAEQMHLDRYTLFMQDYGGPVGFRVALAHPEKVQAMIIQNAVSHEEGLSPLWPFVVPFGKIDRPMKPRCEAIYCLWSRLVKGTSAPIQIPSNTILIYGLMSTISSISRGKRTFNWTFSMTIKTMSNRIHPGKSGSEITGLRSSYFGAAMTPLLP
jgi:pimeloyl-ACP methyl ester carboxylesterase